MSLFLDDFGSASEGNLASACIISGADTRMTHNDTACGEVRSLDAVHELFDRCVLVLDKYINCVDNLTEIMGRNICSHTYGNTCTAVYQKIWKTRRQNGRLF